MPLIAKISDQSSHWYTRSGAPCYEVPRADGTGTRATTLADARKLDLLPSVTTIVSCLRKPQLEAWKVEQGILAALTLPRDEGEDLDAYAARVALDAERQSREAMDLGSRIHAAVGSYHGGDQSIPDDPAVRCALTAYIKWASQRLDVTHTERPFACSELGYAGRVDLYGTLDGQPATLDIKTRRTTPGKASAAYESDGMQLAAYAYGSGAWLGRIANIIISTSEPERIELVEWTDQKAALFQAFSHLREVWCYLHNYNPADACAVAEWWRAVLVPEGYKIGAATPEPDGFVGQVAGLRQLASAEWRMTLDLDAEVGRAAVGRSVTVGSMLRMVSP